MISLIIFLCGVLIALGFGALSALSDLRTLKIPNHYSLVIVFSFLSAYGVLWMFDGENVFAPLLNHLTAAVLVFVVTFIMFHVRVWGAGDSKLASAYALWLGFEGLFPFLFYTALVGGMLGLAALYIRKKKPFAALSKTEWIAALQNGQSKVPYGIAIFLGALASFVYLGYLSPEVFASFVRS